MKVIEKAYAKVNLTLNVLGKRSDGYHNLKMIMSPISLYDEVIVEDNNTNEVHCDFDGLNGENNIVYRCIQMIKDKYQIDKNVKVTINKKIPVGAGLGGGSADCAATLRALNQIWNLRLSLDELANIGIELGADVPFCIYNRQAVVSGIGQNIEFIENSNFHLVLVVPKFGVSTKDIFTNLRKTDFKDVDITTHLTYLKDNNITSLKRILFNDLQHTTLNMKHDLKTLLDEIKCYDKHFIMTGSGSVLFSIFKDEYKALDIKKKLDKTGKNTLKVSSICNRFQNLI